MSVMINVVAISHVGSNTWNVAKANGELNF